MSKIKLIDGNNRTHELSPEAAQRLMRQLPGQYRVIEGNLETADEPNEEQDAVDQIIDETNPDGSDTDLFGDTDKEDEADKEDETGKEDETNNTSAKPPVKKTKAKRAKKAPAK